MYAVPFKLLIEGKTLKESLISENQSKIIDEENESFYNPDNIEQGKP